MKRAIYIILLAGEAFIGLLSVGQLYSWFGWAGCIAAVVLVAALLVPLILRQKKQKEAGNAAARKKTLRRIALVLLIPTAVTLAIGICIVVSMIMYFA